jgi:hypothetical protein
LNYEFKTFFFLNILLIIKLMLMFYLARRLDRLVLLSYLIELRLFLSFLTSVFIKCLLLLLYCCIRAFFWLRLSLTTLPLLRSLFLFILRRILRFDLLLFFFRFMGTPCTMLSVSTLFLVEVKHTSLLEHTFALLTSVMWL